jgi:DnaK suppressor protein
MATRRIGRETSKRLETLLRNRHTELAEQIRSLRDAAARSGERASADQSDRAVASFQHEIDALRLDRLGAQVLALEVALDRLSRRKYGLCDDCGEFVGLGRLSALPFTRRCRGCQSQAEAKSSSSRSRRLARATGQIVTRDGSRQKRELDVR